MSTGEGILTVGWSQIGHIVLMRIYNVYHISTFYYFNMLLNFN